MTYNWLYPYLKTKSLDLSEHSLTQFDCLVLANFLATTPEDHVWDEINLSSHGLTNDHLEIFQKKKHEKRDICCLCLTKNIVISTRPRKIAIDLLTPLLMKESKVENLKIPFHHFPTSCKTIKGYDLSEKTLLKISIISGDLFQRLTSKGRYQYIYQYLYQYSFCLGVLKLLEYCGPKKYIPKLDLDAQEDLKTCSECNTSGHDIWKIVVKLCRYVVEEIQIRNIDLTEFNILSSLIESLKYNRTLLQINLTTNSILSYEDLVCLKTSTQASATVTIEDYLTLSISNDNNVHINIFGNEESSSLLPHYLEQSLPPELHGVRVTIRGEVCKSVLVLLGKSKIVTSLALQSCDTKIAKDFQEMLINTQTMQTLTLDNCKPSDTFIKDMKHGLSQNTAVTLTVLSRDTEFSPDFLIESPSLYELDIQSLHLTKEGVSKLSQIIEECKQLKVLKVKLKDDPEAFFNALSGNQSLRELTIKNSSPNNVCLKLLFQILPIHFHH